MSSILLIVGCVREDSKLHRRQFEESRHMLGPTMVRDRLSHLANSALAPLSHVHRDKCASSPPTRSYWPFAGSFGTWGRLIQVFLHRPVRPTEHEYPAFVALTRWQEGVGSRGTALQRISTAQTERLGLSLPLLPLPFNWDATRVRSGRRNAKRAERDRSERKRRDDQGGVFIDRLAYVPRFNQSLLKTLSFAWRSRFISLSLSCHISFSVSFSSPAHAGSPIMKWSVMRIELRRQVKFTNAISVGRSR